MAESSFKTECPLETRQAEENKPDTIPAIEENTARSDITDIDKKKNLSKKRSQGPSWLRTGPIGLLDIWNIRSRKKVPARTDTTTDTTVKSKPRWRKKQFAHLTRDMGKLREQHPGLVPVKVRKDARSDIPEIDMKKYFVPGGMPLGEFVNFIRSRICLSNKKPIFVVFKNGEAPTGALMAAIDEENKDEDGYLHLTYRGETLCGSFGDP